MARDADEAAASVRRIRQLLADWLQASAESREPVAEILRQLEPIDAYIQLGGQRRPRTKAELGRGGTTTYTIEKKKNEEEVLVEHREGGSTPYRCPRYVYNATVRVLADVDPALEFEGVVKELGKEIAEPPEWQVRVVLRFLMNAQPPLVVKERNKYRPLRPAKFEGEAKSAWQTLAKASR